MFGYQRDGEERNTREERHKRYWIEILYGLDEKKSEKGEINKNEKITNLPFLTISNLYFVKLIILTIFNYIKLIFCKT
jgi:hypothetical protein